MKSLLLSLISPLLLPSTLASITTSLMNKPTFDPNLPIYLGEVFWPPSMTFLAFLPSPLLTANPTSWCNHATDASNHALFSLGGIDALQIHNYFDDQAYITREGQRWADCWVTPETGRMGACKALEEFGCEAGEEAHKFTGPGTRRWSCWINDMGAWGEEEKVKNGKVKGEEEQEERSQGEAVTDAMFTPSAVVTGAVASSPMMGAFTAGVTGS